MAQPRGSSPVIQRRSWSKSRI